ncbi:ABC transporter substrate-binding protein [Candidatus Berkiella aquae]|uniref:ABC transporter substrate-binding protein n=1 Tax=Candidatus Berkiella aquae TaxID=295108 RepID=A0A0Q9YX12_9GAMM|nr:ABC transporter substrate-binding protein [Candidatus Berkiella aquae]MCS5710736.1 ABC transporter substrate-binding protein [Candidatus Berkiella aquae]
MRSMVRHLYLVFVLFFAVSTTLFAEEPDVLLQRVTKQMIDSLRQNDKDLQQHPEKIYDIIEKILVPHIDWIAMSRWVVGRNAWQSASDDQKKRFVKEFKDLLIRTYASTLRAYNNQTIDYLPIRGGTQGKPRVLVSSLIKEPGREPIRVTYRLVNNNNAWQVYDIAIEGVSLLKGFQSQFATEIQQNGLEKLIQHLREHNEKPLQ